MRPAVHDTPRDRAQFGVARAVLSKLAMKRYLLVGLAACGGHGHEPTTPRTAEPRLVPTVAEQSWYHSSATCAQGPFELTVPVGNTKYGEAVELAVRTPRKISIHAEVVGATDLATVDDVFDASGRVGGSADNARCVADARERLALVRGQRSQTPGGSATTPTSPGGSTSAAPPPATATTATLEVEPRSDIIGTSVIQIQIPAGTTSLHIRWWSAEPNDLEGVVFGVSHVVWNPTVPPAQYEAYVADQEARRVADEARRAAEEARRVAEENRQAELRARAEVHVDAPPARPRHVAVVQATPAEIEAARRDEEKHRRDEEKRRQDAEQKRLRDEERERLRIAADIRAAEERKQFCATHARDRGCWGPGGLEVKLALDARAEEARSYCAGHREDARCWTDADWARMRDADQHRLALATAAPAKPSGPPPAPLAESIPPRLSEHAEWRPGYWQWIDATWVWLAGMWRVPDSDIAANQTTTAPIAPPPLQVETPSVQPVRTAVWIAGFWQWNGTSYIWIPGSWQLRPGTSVEWRAATWQPRGSVHVLVPGAWVRIGVGGSR